jgi:hypothetical protein
MYFWDLWLELLDGFIKLSHNIGIVRALLLVALVIALIIGVVSCISIYYGEEETQILMLQIRGGLNV